MSTKIEWATRAWNPITGCTKGCNYCYARRFAERMKHHPNPKIAHKYRNGFEPTVHRELVFDSKKWRKPERVFVGSMGDLFDTEFGRTPFWNLMFEMSNYIQHTYMLLTKQPENMLNYVQRWCDWKKLDKLPANIWCGVTVTNQEEANRLIPILLEVPAVVKFVSIEPMTGPVTLMQKNGNNYHNFLTGEYAVSGQSGTIFTDSINWVIVGGMTGHNSTPMHPGWVLCIKDHCEFHKVPFFFKGWGDWSYINDDTKKYRTSRMKWVDFVNGDLCNALAPFPEKNETHHHELMCRIGRKATGRLLRGVEWNQFPDVKSLTNSTNG